MKKSKITFNNFWVLSLKNTYVGDLIKHKGKAYFYYPCVGKGDLRKLEKKDVKKILTLMEVLEDKLKK